jgi:hypothetical protein
MFGIPMASDSLVSNIAAHAAVGAASGVGGEVIYYIMGKHGNYMQRMGRLAMAGTGAGVLSGVAATYAKTGLVAAPILGVGIAFGGKALSA